MATSGPRRLRPRGARDAGHCLSRRKARQAGRRCALSDICGTPRQSRAPLPGPFPPLGLMGREGAALAAPTAVILGLVPRMTKGGGARTKPGGLSDCRGPRLCARARFTSDTGERNLQPVFAPSPAMRRGAGTTQRGLSPSWRSHASHGRGEASQNRPTSLLPGGERSEAREASFRVRGLARVET